MRLAKKVEAGADFAISQHIFDLSRWKEFVLELHRTRIPEGFRLLGAVAVLPNAEVARGLNRTLHGFTIPDAVVARLEQARDPQAEGIAIAAETINELQAMPEVSGCLIAALAGGGEHVMTSGLSEVEVTRAVVEQAGSAPERPRPGGALADGSAG